MSEMDACEPRHGERRVAAVVTAIDGSRATVLVGAEHEPWDFPAEMLPGRAEVGTYLVVVMLAGRPQRCEIDEDRELQARAGLDQRLARLARYEALTGHEVRVE